MNINRIRALSRAMLALTLLTAIGCSSGEPGSGSASFVDVPIIPILDSGILELTNGAIGGTQDLVLSGGNASVTLPASATISTDQSVYDSDGNGTPEFIIVTLRPVSGLLLDETDAQRDGNPVGSANFNKVGGIALQPLDASFSAPVSVTVPVSSAAQSNTLDVYRWDEGGTDGQWVFVTTAARTGTSATFSVSRFGQFILISPEVTGGGGGGDNMAPTAVIEATPQAGDAPLEVMFDAADSTDPDSDALTYNWDFGDGDMEETADDPTATHSYDEDGQYEAEVTVTDTAGNSDTATITISVGNQAPTVTIMAEPSAPAVDEEVTFTATATDADGTVENYAWDFDDDDDFEVDEEDENTTTFSFDTAGTHEVRVQVTDDEGATGIGTLSITVGGAGGDDPQVTVQADRPSVQAGDTVTFTVTATATAPATIESYEFDFGDGDGTFSAPVDTLPDPLTHMYDDAGSYEVRVRVTDSEDRTAIGMATVVVAATGGNQPPTAELTATPGTGDESLVVTLDASGSDDPDGEIVQYEFDLDNDGTFETDNEDGATFQHTFDEGGTYTVGLRVTDDGDPGLTATDTVEVTVTEPGSGATFAVRGFVAQQIAPPQPNQQTAEGLDGISLEIVRSDTNAVVATAESGNWEGPQDAPLDEGYFEFTDVPELPAGSTFSYILRPSEATPSGEAWIPAQRIISTLEADDDSHSFIDGNGFIGG